MCCPPQCANHISSFLFHTGFMIRFWCRSFADWLKANDMECCENPNLFRWIHPWYFSFPYLLVYHVYHFHFVMFSDPADTIIHLYRRVTFAADLMRIDYMSRYYQEDIATSFTFTCVKKLPNNKFLVSRGDQSAQKRFTCIQVRCPVFHCKPIQVLSYNSLVIARQNVPITSILTNCTLGSWQDFDFNLSLIDSKEMIWKTCFVFEKTSDF